MVSQGSIIECNPGIIQCNTGIIQYNTGIIHSNQTVKQCSIDTHTHTTHTTHKTHASLCNKATPLFSEARGHLSGMFQYMFSKFPTKCHCSVVLSPGIVTRPVDVHRNFPTDFQWHFPMDFFLFCL